MVLGVLVSYFRVFLVIVIGSPIKHFRALEKVGGKDSAKEMRQIFYCRAKILKLSQEN